MSQQNQTQPLLTVPADVLQNVLNYLAEQPYNKVSTLITSLVQNAKIVGAPAEQEATSEGN